MRFDCTTDFLPKMWYCLTDATLEADEYTIASIGGSL